MNAFVRNHRKYKYVGKTEPRFATSIVLFLILEFSVLVFDGLIFTNILK